MPYTQHVSRYVLRLGAIAVVGSALHLTVLANTLGGWAALVTAGALAADGLSALLKR